MRVYFAPCGIGLGHVGRCIPIAEALFKQNVEIIFSTYKEGAHYVAQEGYPLIEAPPIGFQVKPDGAVDFRQTAINPGPFFASFTLLKQINAEIEAIASFNPDVIVSDSRLSPLLAARALRIPRICLLNQFQIIIPRREHFLRLARFADSVTLAIIGKMWTSGNTVLIPDFPWPYTISAGNLTIPKSYMKNVRLVGPILPIHPNRLPPEDRLRDRLGLPGDKPVIFVPISGPTAEKAFFSRILRKIMFNLPQNLEVVISYGRPSSDNEPKHQGNVTVFNWIPNRFEYLKASDVVVGRAGHGTIAQCMCYGKPMILVPTPGHTEQLNNAKQAEDLGIGKIILQDRLNRTALMKGIQQTLQDGTRERLEEIQNETLKYDGLKTTINAIFEAGVE
jgi:UDP:flavonoid glycosyltransferase YjiC (YdhE family)